MDTAQWAQGIGVVKQPPLPPPPPAAAAVERRTRPMKEQALNCPRCTSPNTKFCYYNNYSLSQPRYFCKTCRRYWTEGGSLRNVPVGGGSRKNKRPNPPTPPSSSTPVTKKLNSTIADQNPKIHHGQDLNLSYPPPPPPQLHHQNHAASSAMELLKSGIAASSRGLSSFMPVSLSSDASGGGGMYGGGSAGFPTMQDFKPGLNLFGLEGFENGYGGGLHHGIHDQEGGSGGARMLFPVEDLKQVQSGNNGFEEHNRSQGEDSTPHGYWNRMLGGVGGGGGSW